MKSNKFSINRILLLIGLISVVVLTLSLVWNDLNYSFFIQLLFDDAREFADKGTITSGFMPVGYSSFLGSCLKISGVGGIPACQAFIYIGVLLVIFLFLRLGGVRGILLALGVLVIAFHPVLLLNIWRIHDGNITVLLLFGYLAAGISFLRLRNMWSVLAMSIFVGLLFTVRANTISLVLPAIFLLFSSFKVSPQKNLKRIAIFLVVTIVVFVSVNMIVKQRLFFFPEHGFYNLFAGTNEYSEKYLLKNFSGEKSLGEALNIRGYPVETFDEWLSFPPETYKELALEYVIEHPFEYVKLAALKSFTILRPGYHITQDFVWGSVEGLKRFSKIILSLPFFVWVFFVWKTKKGFFDRENMLIFLSVVFYIIPFLLANADPRFRFPLDIIFIADSFRRAASLPFFQKR